MKADPRNEKARGRVLHQRELKQYLVLDFEGIELRTSEHSPTGYFSNIVQEIVGGDGTYVQAPKGKEHILRVVIPREFVEPYSLAVADSRVVSS